MSASRNHILFSLAVAIGLLTTIWLRLPYISEGSPYFYREDEAHHFNRIVNMMKTRDMDPHYFHKPSLHFYLRMPSVAIGYYWAKQNGEIQSFQQIVSSDPFGIANYAFNSSHPRILKVARLFSVLLQVASILLTYLIAVFLLQSRWLALLAAVLFAFSPAAIAESAVIGVDGPMTFFCLASVLAGLWAHKTHRVRDLFLCSLFAGLAVSSKYNALPIFALPALLFVFNKPFTFPNAMVAFVVPWLAFLLASPYIIVSLPEFIEQLSYEIWHYGVAGHVGHEAERGWPQIKFYSAWLSKDGVGLIAYSLAVCGVLLLARKSFPEFKSKFVIFAVFPILFFLLMIAQKANFVRNMTVIIPFIGIFAAIFLNHLKTLLSKKILAPLACCSLLFPATLAFEASKATANLPETRAEAESLILALATDNTEIALDGKLQFPRSLLEKPGVSRIDFSKTTAAALFQNGFSYLVIPSADAENFSKQNLYSRIKSFHGVLEEQRIIKNPSISILKRSDRWHSSELGNLKQLELSFLTPKISFQDLAEGQVWIDQAVQELNISSSLPASILKLKVFSPWQNQNLRIFSGSKVVSHTIPQNNSFEVEIPLDGLPGREKMTIESSSVHSPKALGISNDSRRLAFAIKEASIQ